jgi:hypothetical protein
MEIGIQGKTRVSPVSFPCSTQRARHATRQRFSIARRCPSSGSLTLVTRAGEKPYTDLTQWEFDHYDFDSI